ncbi:transcriptional regulator swi6 [Serendipita sp. 411]|nr:transcriptional regulator swi6 [Serendipita sp. 411]
MNVAPQPRVYPAVYSGVGVFECMIRGIAVMRRRVDSYVNATQILKVAGIDKGRRTKILEKEILPGKHEIVQGGYGKYQGTWIPLDRGREVANQFGVSNLLAPLFDHVPNPAVMGSLPPQLGAPLRGPGQLPPMPFPHMRPPHPYMIPYMPPNMIPGRPPIFPPGTPVYSPYQQLTPGPGGQPRLAPIYSAQPLPPGTSMPQHPMMAHPFIQATGTPPIYVPVRSPSRQSTSQGSSHKRARDDGEGETPLSQGTDVTMRVPEASYYLETILMWVAEHQGNRFETLVDLQDENDDSALNIAARLGCRPIIKTLLACGAHLDLPNRFGLKATDYGLLGENIEDHLVDSDSHETRGPESLYRPSEHVLYDMKTLIESMERDISSEKAIKSTEYETLQTKLREATRTLAEKRKELETLQVSSKEADHISERISKLEILSDKPETDLWTGRMVGGKGSDSGDAPPAFRGHKALQKRSVKPYSEKEIREALDLSLNRPRSLVILRRTKLWHERVSSLLKQHQASVEDASAAELSKLERVISLCTGLSGDGLDQRVGALLESMESETQNPGQMRLAAFMEKVRSRVRGKTVDLMTTDKVPGGRITAFHYLI